MLIIGEKSFECKINNEWECISWVLIWNIKFLDNTLFQWRGPFKHTHLYLYRKLLDILNRQDIFRVQPDAFFALCNTHILNSYSVLQYKNSFPQVKSIPVGSSGCPLSSSLLSLLIPAPFWVPIKKQIDRLKLSQSLSLGGGMIYQIPPKHYEHFP